MSRSRFGLALIGSLALSACGKHDLPVTIKQCDVVDAPGGASVTVKVLNGSSKPVVNVGIVLDFYRDFKFARVNGIGIFHPAIAPGGDADTSLAIVEAKGAGGQAQRCAIVRVTYGDGTQKTAEAPAAR